MSRFDTLEQKINKLIDRSFTNLVSQENSQKRLEELVAFMQYFENKKLYIIDQPIFIVPHPDGARRLVDPNLINAPSNITLHVSQQNFNNSYELVETFNQLIDEGKEIFIFSLDYLTVYDHNTFEPNHRVSVRYAFVDFNYWYTQVNEPVNGNDLYIPNTYLNDEITPTNVKTLEIINDVLRHKF